MRKIQKTAILTLCISFVAPCVSAKKLHAPNKISTIIMQTDKIYRISRKSTEEYKNKEILKKLPSVSDEEIQGNDKKISITHQSDRSVTKTILSWLAIVCTIIFFVRILAYNFKIPFTYDPNFKNKHFRRQKSKNKKYKF